MSSYEDFVRLSPMLLADVLSVDSVMDHGIRPVWMDMPRVAGPAFTVRCPPGDSLMLHAAIYMASPGAVIVVQAGDCRQAVAGGNVCAIARRRGIRAFVIDGVIRDLAEIRQIRFPVLARGIVPVPAGKLQSGTLDDAPVRCGGIDVAPGDIVVADEEGIVVVPRGRADEVLNAARGKAIRDATVSQEQWEAAHRRRTDEALRASGHAGVDSLIRGPARAL